MVVGSAWMGRVVEGEPGRQVGDEGVAVAVEEVPLELLEAHRQPPGGPAPGGRIGSTANAAACSALSGWPSACPRARK